MDLLKYILGELSAIRAAPVAFVLSLVAASLLIFNFDDVGLWARE
jgi:hypothetical protein